MGFHNIVWNKNENLDGYKLNKMINNDNINYNLALKAPKGLLSSLDIESLSESTRTIGTTAASKVLGNIYVYNKNLPVLKRQDDSIFKRYYKFCISDLTIRDEGTSVEANASSPFYPMDRGFWLAFQIKNKNGVEVSALSTRFGTTLKPGRSTTSATTVSSPTFWRSQAGEFIIPFEEHSFVVTITLEKYLNSRTPNDGGYTLLDGRIWIEDIGMESF